MNKVIASATLLVIIISFHSQNPIFTLSALNENNIATISWQLNEDIEVVGYSLYIEEGYAEKFPKDLVTNSIPVNATQWKSNLRKSLKVFNFDLKHPSQWTDKGVITPGEIYTIGLEIKYLDPTTQEVVTTKDFTHIYPFTVITKLDADPNGMIQEINPSEVQITDSDISLVLENKSNQTYFNMDKKPILINKIEEYPRTYYFYLETGRLLKVYKYPERPRLYGEKNLALSVFYFVLFCILVISTPIIYIAGKSVKYINYLSLPKNNPCDVMKSIIKNETFWVFIIHIIDLSSRNYLPNKILNILVSESLTSHQKLFNEIHKILSTYKFYELSRIKAELLKLFEYFCQSAYNEGTN